jgi:hypothetical protein
MTTFGLAGIANRWHPDAYVVIEDDDVYLPRYVSSHAAVLETAEYSKPSVVLSDYPGHVVEERAEGRFHGSIGFRRALCERIGGWPATLRADFDQQMLARLQQHASSVGDPCALAPPQYLFRWHTGHWHGQHAMRGPEDEGWYGRVGSVERAQQISAHESPRTTTLYDRTTTHRATAGLECVAADFLSAGRCLCALRRC